MTFTPTNPIDTPDFSQQPAIGGFVFAQAQNITIAAGQNNFGPWYVGNVQSTISKIFCGANVGDWINLTWWADQQMSSSINSIQYKKANQSWTVDNNPNYGPWLSIQIESNGGVGQSGVYYQLSGVPIWSPIGTVGQWAGSSAGVLAYMPYQAVASGATVSITPGAFVPGPAKLYMYNEKGNGQYLIVPKAGTYANNSLGGSSISTGARGPVSVDIVLPYDDWQLQVTNLNAAADNLTASVITLR